MYGVPFVSKVAKPYYILYHALYNYMHYIMHYLYLVQALYTANFVI